MSFSLPASEFMTSYKKFLKPLLQLLTLSFNLLSFVFYSDLPWIHTSFPLLCCNLQLLSINCPSSFHLGNFLLFYHQRYPINFIVKVTDKVHYTTCPRILVPLWDSTYIRGVEAQGNPLAAILFKKKKKNSYFLFSFISLFSQHNESFYY